MEHSSESRPEGAIRDLRFYGSGSRPLTEVTTRRARYWVRPSTDGRQQQAADAGDGCIFYRPGCPCGVPF